MKTLKYIILIVSGCVFYACDTNEFLNPVPDTAVTVDSYFQSDADVESGKPIIKESAKIDPKIGANTEAKNTS